MVRNDASPRGSVQPGVGSTRAGRVGLGVQGRVPVEDHVVLLRSDVDLGAVARTELGQPFLDAKTMQPLRQVADGLVVGEVGLDDPAGGLVAAYPEGVVAQGQDRKSPRLNSSEVAISYAVL